MPDAEAARLREQQRAASDMQRTCQVCGKQCHCYIVRSVKPGCYTPVEEARAVCEKRWKEGK